MSDKIKISQLQLETNLKEDSLIPIVQNNKTKAIKSKDLLKDLDEKIDSIDSQLDNIVQQLYTEQELEAFIRKVITAINNENPISDSNDRYLYLGNVYEQHSFKFKKGYVYKLTNLSTCSWCNKTEPYTIDTTINYKEESLKGIYKIETYKDNKKVIPPVDFINSASLYMFLNFTKNMHDILFIGDSLTDIGFSTFPFNYVNKLGDSYKDKYNFITHIANFGHTVTDQLNVLKKFTSILSNSSNNNNEIENIYTKDKIKIVSIFVGTNDIDHATQTFETFTTNYTEMINHIKTNYSKAKIILITPFLCKKSNNAIKYINKIKELGIANNCEIVDLSTFSELDSTKTDFTDYYLEEECIHLTEKGWNLINDEIISGYKNVGIDTIYLTPPIEPDNPLPEPDTPSSGSSNNLEWTLGNINAGDGNVISSNIRVYSSLATLNVNDVITIDNNYSFQCFAYDITTEEFSKYITSSWVKSLTINDDNIYKYRFVIKSDSNNDLTNVVNTTGKKLNIN